MFRQIHFRVFWIGCFLSMFLLLSAQSKLDSLHHLHEVVITAKINKEVIPVQSLSGDKLEKLAVHSVFGCRCHTLFFGSTNKGLRWNRRIEDRKYPKYGDESCRSVL